MIDMLMRQRPSTWTDFCKLMQISSSQDSVKEEISTDRQIFAPEKGRRKPIWRRFHQAWSMGEMCLLGDRIFSQTSPIIRHHTAPWQKRIVSDNKPQHEGECCNRTIFETAANHEPLYVVSKHENEASLQK